MPFDIWPDPPIIRYGHSRTLALSSAGSPTGHHQGSEGSHDDPSDLFVPHVDPEDEAGLLAHEDTPQAATRHALTAAHAKPGEAHGEHAPHALDEPALAAFIATQAAQAGVDLLRHGHERHHVCFPTEVARHVWELFGKLASENEDESKRAVGQLTGLRDRLGARVSAAQDPGPSNLQRSVALFRHLWEVFKGVGGTLLVGQDLDWPVPGGSNPSVRTAGLDLETFYRLRPAHDPGGSRGRTKGQHRGEGICDDNLIIRHSAHALFEELDTLRNRTGGRIVNLYSDWRMWLAWLHTRNPILALAWMTEDLARPDGDRIGGCYKPEEIEHDRALRAFLVVGYEIEKGQKEFQCIVRDVANGARSHRDLPIRYLLRNSWDPSWGNGGHAWIKHRDLSRQLGLGSGLLLPGTGLPGA